MRRPSVVGMHEFSADADADAQAAARPPGGPRHSGRRHVSLKEHQVIEAGAAEERFALSADVKCPHDGSGSPVRLHGGILRTRGDRGSERPPPHWPADVIVDGDLVIDGGPDWWEGDGGQYKFLLVTGDLRAHSVHISGCVDVVVRGDLQAADGILGRGWDDRGSLRVAGPLRAAAVVTTEEFTVTSGSPAEADRRVAIDPRNRGGSWRS